MPPIDLQQEQLESEAEQQAAQEQMVQAQQAEQQSRAGQAKQMAKEAIKQKVKQQIKQQAVKLAARSGAQAAAATVEIWGPALLIILGVLLFLLLIAYGYYCTESVSNAVDCYNDAGPGIVPMLVAIKGARWIKDVLGLVGL